MPSDATSVHIAFGRVVEGHMQLPRQIMRGFKSVPEEKSVTEFLDALCSSLRDGSLHRTLLVRGNRPSIKEAESEAVSDSARRMVERAKDLLALAHAESTSMVRMIRKLRQLRESIAPLEREILALGQSSGSVDKAREIYSGQRLKALVASLIESTQSDLVKDTSDPYKGTLRLVDFLDLSDAAINPLLENLGRANRAAESEQLDRFVRGVVIPRLEQIVKDAESLRSGQQHA